MRSSESDTGAGWLRGILIVSLVLRLAAVPLVHSSSYLSDEREYILIAQTLLGEGEFVDSNGFRSVRAPLFPFFLAGIFGVSGGSVALAHVAGCLLGVAGVLLVHALALRLWNDRRSALVAAALAGFHPSLVIYSTLLLTESLYIVLLLAALVMAHDFEARPSWRRAVGLGVLAGLASLTRPVFLGYFPVLLALIALRGRAAGRRWLVLSFLAWGVVIAPWTIRNVLLHGELVIVGSGAGSSLLTGNNPYATGTWRVEPGYEEWLTARMAERGVNDVASLSETELGHLSGAIALDYIRKNPARAAELALTKTHIFWIYPVAHTDAPGALQAGVVAFDALLWVAVVLGAVGGRGAKRWLVILAASALFFWMAQALLHSEARFRLPLVPLMAVVAGEGLRVFADPVLRRAAIARRGARALLGGGVLVVASAYGWTAYMVITGVI